MSTRMLIDARHQEETRVAVVRGNRVEEFDYESASRRQLKGNIYLAKVTRVEPSLQAAFVEYGGNRHAFLAFSEIHPDYYQIPVEDRARLVAEERALRAEERDARKEEVKTDEVDADTDANENEDGDDTDAEVEPAEELVTRTREDDAMEEEERRKQRARNIKRRYKIQEVIRRGQVMLIQVVKEERGNKGAAVTTYLSLAGRYCVLMPNSTHGGGISRKISSGTDRRRLKQIMTGLDLPDHMGCIIRTAGMKRSKNEIKRDFDYLFRQWDDIRELTLKSIAPALVYEESDLIRRSIRDIYSREIDEILIEGEAGYRHAKDFMKMLMPSHAKKVQQYKDRIPLFHRYQVESQIDAMYSPVVTLKSGGYIVINPTEALVAIDVNSGKSTKEHNIEGTALATNLEAADEIARQLRLRDMAGLIVIDFIDMEERNNVRNVERRVRDALKLDRARIAIGKISSFGLLEMSRQRLNPGLLEVSSVKCPHCEGAGSVRSIEAATLHLLRMLEEEGIRARSAEVTVRVSPEVAAYVLNHKRASITEIEDTYRMRVVILAEEGLSPAQWHVERVAFSPEMAAEMAKFAPTPIPEPKKYIIDDEDDEDIEDDADGEDSDDEDETPKAPKSDDGGRKKRRRRRRGRKDRTDSPEGTSEDGASDEGDEDEDGDAASDKDETAPGEDKGERKKRRRRRRRRGGRPGEEGQAAQTESADAAEPSAEAPQAEETPVADVKPARKPRGRKAAPAEAVTEVVAEPVVDVVAEVAAEPIAAEKPKRSRAKKAAAPEVVEAVPAEEIPEKPKRGRAKKAVEPAVEAVVETAADEAAPTEEPRNVPGVNVVDVDAAKDGGKQRKGWWRRITG